MRHRTTVSFALASLLSITEALLTLVPLSKNVRTTTASPFFATVADDREYLVEVTYEGRSCRVALSTNETILSGLERARATDQLAIPELPSDCRRGNCLTCVGRHARTSQESSLRRGEDGLSPEISRRVHKKGYVLTCSSRVVGDGVKLELGENFKAWKDIYYDRLYDESTQYVSRSAMARTIRLSDERNPELWVVKTETALDIGGDADDDQD